MKWFHRTSNTGCGGADAAADEPKLIKISPLKHARAARCGHQRLFLSFQAFLVIFHSEETYMFQNDGGSWFDYEISNVSPFEFLYYVPIPQGWLTS